MFSTFPCPPTKLREGNVLSRVFLSMGRGQVPSVESPRPLWTWSNLFNLNLPLQPPTQDIFELLPLVPHCSESPPIFKLVQCQVCVVSKWVLAFYCTVFLFPAQRHTTNNPLWATTKNPMGSVIITSYYHWVVPNSQFPSKARNGSYIPSQPFLYPFNF